MDLKKLLKLSETNKAAACKAFVASYDTARIIYSDSLSYAEKDNVYQLDRNKNLIINNSSFWKTVLNAFGHLLKEISVEGDQKSTFSWTEIVSVIFVNCTTLQKLCLFNFLDFNDIDLMLRGSSVAQELSRNPLRIIRACPTLETLDAEGVYIEASLQMANIFPNLRSLNLRSIVTSDPSFVEVTMPRLEHLGIMLHIDEDYAQENEPDTVGSHLKLSNMKNAFIYNPQLRSIQVEIVKPDMALVEFISTTLPNLKKIDLSLSEEIIENHSSKDNIEFNNVTDASLGRLGAKKPPIIFKQLKTLDFNTAAHTATLEFIREISQLIILELFCDYTDAHAIELIKTLPNLEEMSIITERMKKWHAAGLVRFLAIGERLKKSTLLIPVDSKDHENWRSYVSDAWSIDDEKEGVYAIRKCCD